MAWAIQSGMFASILRGLRSYALLCDLGDWITQGVSQLEDLAQALKSQPFDPELRKILAMTLTQQGDLFFRQGLFDQARARLEESLEILRSFEAPDLRCGPLVFSGVITQLFGELDRAQAITLEGLACAQAAGDRWFEAYAILNLGYIEGLKGNYSQCFEQMLSGIELWRSLGDPRYTALGLNYISTYAITLGRPGQAQEFLQESLALCTQIGDRWGMGTAYRNLGLAALAQGDPDQARSLIEKSLDLFTDFTTGWDIARSLNFLGLTLEASRDYKKARHAYQQAIEHALEVNAYPLAMDSLLGLGRLLAETGDNNRAAICLLRVIQDPVSTQETRDDAQHCLDSISYRLNSEQIDQARDHASTLSLRAMAEMMSQDPSQPSGC
jgi:tetratricopeptide (TPR) repeat protein